MHADDRSPGNPARAVEFASLHGKEYVVRPAIAADQFYLGGEDVLHEPCVDIRLGPGAFAAEGRRLRQKIVPGLDRRRSCAETDDGVLGDAAEPGKFPAVK